MYQAKIKTKEHQQQLQMSEKAHTEWPVITRACIYSKNDLTDIRHLGYSI